MLNLPANFETYAEARKSGFMKMKEIKDNGGRIVGVYCSFVPQELLMAAGAAAAPLCASSDEPISCCRDETASQSLSADQSQLRFRTDRHMSLFLFFRFHCG